MDWDGGDCGTMRTMQHERNRTMKTDWRYAAGNYLARLGDAEYVNQMRRTKTFSPTEYQRDLISLLADDDEEGFKYLKMLRGCDSELGL